MTYIKPQRRGAKLAAHIAQYGLPGGDPVNSSDLRNSSLRETSQSALLQNASDDYDPSRDNWRYYNLANDIGGENCSEEQVVDAFLRFAVPGRPPSKGPVRNGERNTVRDPRNGLPAGKITTEISNGGKTITNTTKLFHVLYDGKIERNLKSNPTGGWIVYTYGAGNNKVPFMDLVNEWQGPKVFDEVDRRLSRYLADRCDGEKT